MPATPSEQRFAKHDPAVAELGDFPSEQEPTASAVRAEHYRRPRAHDASVNAPAKIWFETVKPQYVVPAPEPYVATRPVFAWARSIPMETRRAATKALLGCVAVSGTWMMFVAAYNTVPIGIPRVARPEALPIGAPARLTAVVLNRTDAQASSGTVPAAPTVRPAAPAPPAASRRPAERGPGFMGALTVRSVPSGAVVLLDQQPIGRTPLSARQLRAGAHAIWIEHDGYQRWSAAIHVPANAVTQVAATLNRSAR